MSDPFARPTEADRERWLRATRDGTLPRVCLVPASMLDPTHFDASDDEGPVRLVRFVAVDEDDDR